MMLAFDSTQEILGLQDVEAEKGKNSDHKQRIRIKLGRTVVYCSCRKADHSEKARKYLVCMVLYGEKL